MVEQLVSAHKFFNKESKSYISDEKYYRRNYLKAYVKFMYYSFIDYIKKQLLILYIVNRSKPSKDEQVLSDEETDLLLTAHYQTVVDIDKALDYEQSIEDEQQS